MRFPDPLRAREPRASAHAIVLIMGVSTVVLALLTTFGPNSVSGATRAASWAGVVALVGAIAVCVLVPAERLDRAGAFPLIGLGGVLLTCVLNVLTDDPSAGAQAFLAFPVLWAASHLRWAAVALVTGAAVVGDGVTQLVLQPVEPAVHDALVVGTPDSAGKAKRVRAGTQVTLQACGVLGKPRRGSVPVPGSFLVPLVDSGSIDRRGNTNYALLQSDPVDVRRLADVLVGVAMSVGRALDALDGTAAMAVRPLAG